MDIDTSRIDRLEERQRIAADVAAFKQIEAEKEAATQPLREAGRLEIERLDERHFEERLKMRDRQGNERFDLAQRTYEPISDAEHPFMERQEALLPDTSECVEDENRLPVLCAKSGLAIFLNDETLIDAETGETYLRSALGLPPRPPEEDDQEAASEADVAADVAL